MPKKLMNCIKKVMDSGKSESEAWAICISSTGLSPHKSETLNKIVVLANALDEKGFIDEVILLDNTLIREAQWQWFKEKGQQLKDWFSTEKQLDPEVRKQLTVLRQSHWNLIKQINSARAMLNTAWHNMGKPSYLRDLKNVIQYLKRDLTQAVAAAKQAGDAARVLQQAQQQAPTQPETQPTEKPFDPEETQRIEIKDKTSNVKFLEKLLKVASQIEKDGSVELAQEVDRVAIQHLQKMAAGGWFDKAQDWLFSKMSPQVKELSTLHWDLMDKLNSAYGRLQAARQNITNVDSYVNTFLTELGAFEQDLGGVLQSINKLQGVVSQIPKTEPQPIIPEAPVKPEAPIKEVSTEPVTTEPVVTEAPTPATVTKPKGGTERKSLPKGKRQRLDITGLTPEQRQNIMNLIEQYKK